MRPPFLCALLVLVAFGSAAAAPAAPSTHAARTVPVKVFFPQRDPGTGCDRVFARARTVSAPATLRGAVAALLRGPTAAERRAGYAGWFSRRTAGRLNGVALRGGVARVDFRDFRRVIPNASTSCGSALLLAQLNLTVRQFRTVTRAVYSFDGSVDRFYHWLQLASPTAAAAARTMYCSPSGDLCYGAFGTGTTVKLRITLFAGYFTRYQLCVRAPDRKRDCRSFRVHAIEHGMYESNVTWARHFPFRGPGRYVATWDWGSGPSKPAIGFDAGPSIHLSPASIRPGKVVKLFGLAGGCPRGDTVALISAAFPRAHEVAGVPAVLTPVREGDRYSVRVRIPRATAPGRYTIGGRCGGGNFGVTARLRVR